jgi:hypothetical protein
MEPMHTVRRFLEGDEGWIARLQAIDRNRAIVTALAILLVPVAFVLVIPDPLEQPFGVDFDLYREATARWLAGGSYFEPYQIAGPYEIRAGDILYPPVALWLFAPFAAPGEGVLRLAATVAWWAIPLGVTAASVIRLRPAPWTWPLIALCAANPTTLLKVWTGNPVIWSMAALAIAVLSARTRFAAPFALLKPSLAPFALFGANRRSWWTGLAALVALSLPFGALWADWVASVLNSRGGGVLYSALEIPMLLLPLVAWLGRTRMG